MKALRMIAAREDQFPAGTVIPPGCKRHKCGGCGCTLVLAKSSLDMVEQKVVVPTCDRCFAKKWSGETIVAVETQDQIDERRQWERDKAARN